MSKTLVYLSSCASSDTGKPGAFLLSELPWLLAHFDRVLVCGHAGIATVTDPRPERLAMARPLSGQLLAWASALFCREFWRELRHLWADGKLSPTNAGKLYLFTVRGFTLRYWTAGFLRRLQTNTLYSFWMSYDGFAAALLKRRFPEMRAVARGHAFDIDRDRNPMNPYLMKRFMGAQLDGIYPISADAQARLAACAALPAAKVRVLPLGTPGEPAARRFPSPKHSDGVFRVVSCSSLIGIKQVPMLIDALALWRGGPVRWTHIGGGPDERAVRAYAAEKLFDSQSIEFEITGTVEPDRVRRIYAVQPFDVFVNTSRSEGVPVSIMEAMCAGIPIVAPAIGGIPELVDDAFGRLYALEGGAQAVLEALTCIASLNAAQAEAFRAASQARWNERCRSEILLPLLFPEADKEANKA